MTVLHGITGGFHARAMCLAEWTITMDVSRRERARKTHESSFRETGMRSDAACAGRTAISALSELLRRAVVTWMRWSAEAAL